MNLWPTARGWLIMIQVAGGLFLPIWPVMLLFGTISFLAPESGWQGRVIFALLVAYPVIWGILTWLSWRAFQRGRVALAILLSTPPAIPTLAAAGFTVFGTAWEIMTEPGRMQDEEAGRIAAVDLSRVIRAEFAYRSRNQGSFGDLACLAEPGPCVPGYTGLPFVDKALIAPERNGYVRRFHPGPSNAASPRSLASYAYTAVPLSRGHKASYCGDDTGQVWRTTSGGEPGVDGGRCRPAEAYGSPVTPPPVPRRPSGFAPRNEASARSRAPATGKVTRKAAVRRLEELGYDHLDGKSLVDAASEGNNEAVELFLAAGVPIDTPRYDGPSSAGDTAFFAAAQSGYLDTAALLLKAGTNVKVREQSNLAGNYGQTPLMVLSQYCDEAALVNAVIDAGADVNAMARTGDTALKAAEKGPCPEIASILRKAGATR